MLEASGADGVMIGRGAYGRPWLPGQIGHFLENGKLPDPPSKVEFSDLVSEHYEAILGHYGQTQGVRIARKHLGWYLDVAQTRAECVMPGTERRTVMTSDRPAEVLKLVADWFGNIKRTDSCVSDITSETGRAAMLASDGPSIP